jgi:hypothetical protein
MTVFTAKCRHALHSSQRALKRPENSRPLPPLGPALPRSHSQQPVRLLFTRITPDRVECRTTRRVTLSLKLSLKLSLFTGRRSTESSAGKVPPACSTAADRLLWYASYRSRLPADSSSTLASAPFRRPRHSPSRHEAAYSFSFLTLECCTLGSAFSPRAHPGLSHPESGKSGSHPECRVTRKGGTGPPTPSIAARSSQRPQHRTLQYTCCRAAAAETRIASFPRRCCLGKCVETAACVWIRATRPRELDPATGLQRCVVSSGG